MLSNIDLSNVCSDDAGDMMVTPRSSRSPSHSPTPPPIPLRSLPPPPPSESEVDSDAPVPSAPPLTPHIYPTLPPKSSTEAGEQYTVEPL